MAVSLKDCRIGTILVENPERVSEGSHPRIGHVVGLGMNVVGEVMPIMQWARKFTHETTTIDPKDFRPVYSGQIREELMHCSSLDLFTGDSFYEPR